MPIAEAESKTWILDLHHAVRCQKAKLRKQLAVTLFLDIIDDRRTMAW